MKRLICTIITIAATYFFANAQTDADTCFLRQQKELCQWYASKTTARILPKGAKHKTIIYKSQGYSVSGFFHKGKLVDGQSVIFLTDDNIPIISGLVSYNDDGMTITGIKYEETDKGEIRKYGSFQVSNSGTSMTYKQKKAGELSIQEIKIYYFAGFYLDCPVIVCNTDNPSIAIDGKSGGRGYDYLYAPLSQTAVKSEGYDAIIPLLLSVKENVYMKWRNGEYFVGEVHPIMEDDGAITFYLGIGTKMETSQGYRRIEVLQEGDGYMMKLEDNPENKNLETEIIHVSDMQSIPLSTLWNTSEFYRHMSSIDWYYRNGNHYSGQAVSTFERDKDGKEYISTKITKGQFSYANGDTFEGDMSSSTYIGIPVDGVMHFKDGSEESGNWLKNYGLTDAQCIQLSEKEYPSDIRDAAIQIQKEKIEAQKEKQYQQYISKAQNAERRNDYAAAQKLYESAKQLKPDAEDWDKIIADIKLKERKAKFRSEMIGKYGFETGEKIARGIIEIGMTKAMVTDALSSESILPEFYHISQSTNWGGGSTEIWEYDFRLVKEELSKERTRSDNASVNIAMGMLESIFASVAGPLASNKVKYKYLKFKNGKLSEFKNSSIYDDYDNGIGGMMWLLNGLFN